MTEYDDKAVTISPTNWVAEQARLYEESGGTKGTSINGAPCLLMDYLGRRSGTWHRTVLIFGQDGDDYLIVASNGGAADHPLWYLNLQDHPDVELRVYAERFAARAETLSSDEKARVWPGLVDLFAPYADYRKRTERDIPVVRLRRV
ncbi:nitroreductase family deazaflavin-dependent oxidoreductase [Streptomyces sp. H27-D2]|uniref:nitroreductase family deazaflavin-dependent oxidoreductase n=1 Tax=Streptomyces sp. H27-D2 TaxID=3046304 RepID=UPI002DB5DB23|nr:nitroreductase family deazaflavin-dependent oxidoreductase [Streptomyces sp. H27-D2]MEC4019290.1 nitroreductase family deazaflavin-dependent oxidoreductase [Streptomyces sp. H27-D2]